MRTFTAYIEWDPESKLYIGFVPGVVVTHNTREFSRVEGLKIEDWEQA